MPDDESEWLQPDDTMGLWENQGEPLTVRWLLAALGEVGIDELSEPVRQLLATARAAADVPVEVEFYDGEGSRTLRPMHIDMRADHGRPSAVVITVA